METILAARGVTKRFGGLVAVNNFDVDIAEKSISSIIGPNGAGKPPSSIVSPGFIPLKKA